MLSWKGSPRIFESSSGPKNATILFNQPSCLLPNSHLALLFLFSFILGKEAALKRAQPNTSWPAPEKKKTMPVKPADSERNPCTAVYRRPYRDRVIHVLALRTYKKPELLARLQRDGIMKKDKGCLGKILQQVRLCSLCTIKFSYHAILLFLIFTCSSTVQISN